MVCITTLNSILTNRESLLSTYRSFVVTPQSSKSKKNSLIIIIMITAAKSRHYLITLWKCIHLILLKCQKSMNNHL